MRDRDRNGMVWNVKVYDGQRERETLRGVPVARKDTLMTIFNREGVKAQALKYDSDGEMVESESVNWASGLTEVEA